MQSKRKVLRAAVPHGLVKHSLGLQHPTIMNGSKLSDSLLEYQEHLSPPNVKFTEAQATFGRLNSTINEPRCVNHCVVTGDLMNQTEGNIYLSQGADYQHNPTTHVASLNSSFHGGTGAQSKIYSKRFPKDFFPERVATGLNKSASYEQNLNVKKIGSALAKSRTGVMLQQQYRR